MVDNVGNPANKSLPVLAPLINPIFKFSILGNLNSSS